MGGLNQLINQRLVINQRPPSFLVHPLYPPLEHARQWTSLNKNRSNLETRQLAGWLAAWLAGCLAGWLAGWPDGWLARWLAARRRSCWLAGPKDLFKAFKRPLKGLWKDLWRPLKGLLKTFKRSFKGVYKAFKRSFRGFSKVFQRPLNILKGFLRAPKNS